MRPKKKFCEFSSVSVTFLVQSLTVNPLLNLLSFKLRLRNSTDSQVGVESNLLILGTHYYGLVPEYIYSGKWSFPIITNRDPPRLMINQKHEENIKGL